MAPSPLEIRTCDKCKSFREPKRLGWRARCHLTGMTVCRKAKGCHFYKLAPWAPPEFAHPTVTLVQQ